MMKSSSNKRNVEVDAKASLPPQKPPIPPKPEFLRGNPLTETGESAIHNIKDFLFQIRNGLTLKPVYPICSPKKRRTSMERALWDGVKRLRSTVGNSSPPPAEEESWS
jgi:hypothetical protein